MVTAILINVGHNLCGTARNNQAEHNTTENKYHGFLVAFEVRSDFVNPFSANIPHM